MKLWDLATGREMLNLGDHTDWVWMVQFSPDGKTLFSGGNDRDVRLWDTSTGVLQAKLATGVNVYCLAVAPDGNTLAVVGFNELQFWNLESRVKEDTRRVGGSLYCVAYSADGRLLATGNRTGIATLWNAATHEESQNLRGHSDAIFGLAFSPDGRLLATASWDHSVRLWNLAVLPIAHEAAK